MAALRAVSTEDEREQTAAVGVGANSALGISSGTMGCGARTLGTRAGDERDARGNVRVNQDCTFRSQAEATITYNPAQPTNLLAGQNDYRVGPSQCGIDWSIDNGQHWGDLLPPFRHKLNDPSGQEPTAGDPNRHTLAGGPGTKHTYDTASDPIVAFDSRGTGFFGCIALDVNSNASMVFVTASPAGAQGAFFYNIPPASRNYIVVEDNNPNVFHDKPSLAADKYPASPNRDNVYATWTVVKTRPDCGPQPNPGGDQQFCSSPIFGSMSTDQGHHWSTPELISGKSGALCFFGDASDPLDVASACNSDQGSDSTVLPDGELEVIFNNGNTPEGNPNAQQLGVHCRPSGSSPAGTARLNCAEPTRVGADIITGEPLCEFGNGPEPCIPGAYIRTNHYPRINKNVNQNGHLYAAWQDYRSGEYDIQLSVSIDSGRTWTEAGTVNPDRGMDHYFPAVELVLTRESGGNADRVGTGYYRTARVRNENATPAEGFGCPPGTTTRPQFACSGTAEKNSDYVLGGGRGARVPYRFVVLSPGFAPPDGNQSGFNGDYSGLTINRGTEAHAIWSDTRNSNPYPENGVTHDEDVFTATLQLPE